MSQGALLNKPKFPFHAPDMARELPKTLSVHLLMFVQAKLFGETSEAWERSMVA